MRNSRPLPRTRRWFIVQWLTGRQRKTGLNYKRDVCDALVASRPWNDCIQKSSIKIQSWLKSKWSRIQWHSNKKINVLVWTNGVSWTILDDWRCKVYEGWASFGKSSHVAGSNGNLIEWTNKNEHPAGVAPPCRPPPAGCSEIPSRASWYGTAPTGFMEDGHMTWISPTAFTKKI